MYIYQLFFYILIIFNNLLIICPLLATLPRIVKKAKRPKVFQLFPEDNVPPYACAQRFSLLLRHADSTGEIRNGEGKVGGRRRRRRKGATGLFEENEIGRKRSSDGGTEGDIRRRISFLSVLASSKSRAAALGFEHVLPPPCVRIELCLAALRIEAPMYVRW